MREFERHQKISALNLTDLQKKFAESYVQHFVISRAVKEAGSLTKNPAGVGKKLLEHPSVQAYIQILQEDAAGRVDLRLDRILKEQMRVAFAMISNYVEWDNDKIVIKDSSTLTEDQLAAVQEIVQEDTKYGNRIKVKLHAKQPAMDRLLEFASMVEGLTRKGGKAGKGEEQDGSGKHLTINALQVRNYLVDPKTRRAIEHLSNRVFAERNGESIPELTPAMRSKIEELTKTKLVEYCPPPPSVDIVDPSNFADFADGLDGGSEGDEIVIPEGGSENVH